MEPEWDVVERGLGLELPAEYKELLAVFPPGSFLLPDWKGIIVQPPYHVDGVPDHLEQFGAELNELSDWRAEHPQDVPYPLYPEPGGLLPWARADREAVFWVRNHTDPNRWTVAASNGGSWRLFDDDPVVEEYGMGTVDFLIGMVTGELRSRILNPEGYREWEANPQPAGPVRSFTPTPEVDWRGFSYKESPKIRMISLRNRNAEG
ncbi:MAG: hypothetical protein ACJ72N_01725 [Labedaea sp.]